MTLEDNFEKIVGFTFTSTLFIFFGLLSYGVLQDYIMFPLYEIAQNLVSSGVSQSWVLTSIEAIDDVVMFFPQVLDLLWLFSAVALGSELIVTSYYLKRRNYFSLLTLMFWGTLVLLFLMNIYLILSNWVLDELLAKILPEVIYSTPFFNFYLTWAGVINTTLIVVCIIINTVDFDLSTYFQRKTKESQVAGDSLGEEVA